MSESRRFSVAAEGTLERGGRLNRGANVLKLARRLKQAEQDAEEAAVGSANTEHECNCSNVVKIIAKDKSPVFVVKVLRRLSGAEEDDVAFLDTLPFPLDLETREELKRAAQIIVEEKMDNDCGGANVDKNDTGTTANDDLQVTHASKKPRVSVSTTDRPRSNASMLHLLFEPLNADDVMTSEGKTHRCTLLHAKPFDALVTSSAGKLGNLTSHLINYHKLAPILEQAKKEAWSREKTVAEIRNSVSPNNTVLQLVLNQESGPLRRMAARQAAWIIGTQVSHHACGYLRMMIGVTSTIPS